MPPEKLLFEETPEPKGYVLVRKGDVYVTRNSRKLTQETGKIVYVVQSKDKKLLGIRVPRDVRDQVFVMNAATKSTRAAAVVMKDEALEDKMRAELLQLYPSIPKDSIQLLLKHTLQKRSGRVGRTQKLALSKVMDLAARAHIRHSCTDYETLLRRGTTRDIARQQVQSTINEVARSWGRKMVKPQKAQAHVMKVDSALQRLQKKRAKTERKSPGRSGIPKPTSRSATSMKAMKNTVATTTIRKRRRRRNRKAAGATAGTAIVVD